MSENVISIKGGDVVNERREAFSRAVLLSYDRYVTENGYEPDAIVYVLNGVTKASQIAWDVQGGSMGGVVSVLSLAAIHCLAEAQASRQGIEP